MMLSNSRDRRPAALALSNSYSTATMQSQDSQWPLMPADQESPDDEQLWPTHVDHGDREPKL